MSSQPEQDGLSPQTQQALLAQYRECSAHHAVMYQTRWQIPAAAVTISGLVVAAAFRPDVPDPARLAATVVGTVFLFAETVAFERNRLFQLRRKKDMEDIEQRLQAVGVEPITWDFALLVREVDAGAFRCTGGLRLYRLDFFKLFRALMYAMIVLLAILSMLALADTLGAEIFS